MSRNLTTPRASAPELLYLLHGDPDELTAALAEMRVADVAEALNALRRQSPDAAARVLAALPFDVAVRVLDEPELEHRGELFGRRARLAGGVAECAALIEVMSADARAALFRELPEADRSELLAALTAETRRALALLLLYPPTSAGGIMTTDLVAVPEDWTVHQVLGHVRRAAGAIQSIDVIHVVDRDARLVHVLSLRDLLTAQHWRRVGDVGDRRPPIMVGPHTDREEVARLISRYNLLSVPVVDERRRVLGMVTVDDVIDTIAAEHTEDAQKFGGVEALDVPYMEAGVLGMVRKRAGWLVALFLGEMLTATAMGHFEHEIARAVVLALFVPLIISSGGNSGSQATSLVIRAMALGEVRLRDWWRVAARELPSGVMLGAVLGAVGVTRILLWQAVGWYDYGPHHLLVALTVGLALVGVVTFGSLAGSMLPFVLRGLGCDPASASAPFVATLVDVTGLVIYFSVAALVLRGTLL